VAKERTLAILKPGILQRRLTGTVISRIEKKGFDIIGMKLVKISKKTVETHYKEHAGKPFYESLTGYMTSSPSIVMVLERENAVSALRKLTGSTNPDEAQPGTIRGDYGLHVERNIIHASDSSESAKREVELFFTEDEINPFEDGNSLWY